MSANAFLKMFRGAKRNVSPEVSGTRGVFRRALTGGGEESAGRLKNKVTDEYGTFDDEVFSARRLQKDLSAVGVKRPDVGVTDTSRDFKKYQDLEGAAPGVRAHWWGFSDGEIQSIIDRYAARGIKITPQQVEALAARRGGVGGIARSAKNVLIGEAPLQVMKERFVRGGLVGKGGLLTSDLVPDASTRRSTKRLMNALGSGDYGEAAASLPSAAMGGAGYLANLGFSYALPAYGVYQGGKAVMEGKPDSLPALGSSLTSAAANVALAPLGMAQAVTAPAVMSASDRLWGVKKTQPATPQPSQTAPAPVQYPQRANAAQATQRALSMQPINNYTY